MNKENINNQEDFKYIAFISYKHVDSKWALWLRNKLHTYQLPAKTRKKNKSLPKNLYPVFLDKTNLKPGHLHQNLEGEVSSAKFLIVLCSKAAHDEPKYINEEIQFFLDNGGSTDRIIPVIVEPSERPEQECFPSLLQ